jgi:hypothetical protein
MDDSHASIRRADGSNWTSVTKQHSALILQVTASNTVLFAACTLLWKKYFEPPLHF